MRKTIFAMALLASMTAMAQENAKVDVHARYTKVVTPVDGKYESKRPPVEDRLFTSTAVEKKIKEVQKLLKKNPKLAWMFANCYPNTLESTVHYRVLENGDDDTFVYTGDIQLYILQMVQLLRLIDCILFPIVLVQFPGVTYLRNHI